MNQVVMVVWAGRLLRGCVGVEILEVMQTDTK